MAEEHEPSLMEKIADKIKGHDDSSSSDSDNDDHKQSPVDAVKSNIFRLFGRQKPLHTTLGGGKAADVFLWRNKKTSASVLGVATAFWVFFELMEYHLLTLVCHILILALALVFLWSNALIYIKKSPPHIPEVVLPEKCVLEVVSALRLEVNWALAALRDIASTNDLKKFLVVVAGLWTLSVVGSWCNFVTLFYIVFVLLHTVPLLYEKYEDQVDSFGEKALKEFKKQYEVFDEKVLSKIPKGPLQKKKD